MSRSRWPLRSLALFMVGVPLAAIYGILWMATELPRTRDTRTSHIFEPTTDFEVPQPPPEHVLATAYCPCPVCCGKWATEGGGGVTASGKEAEQGVTIAADWSVFPKGVCLAIAGVGKRVVQDTGSAIKGARLDVFFESHEDAVEFGVKRLSVKQC